MKIEKNIPIPFGGKWGRLIREMDFGDSVRVETKYHRSALRYSMIKAGFAPVSRKEHDGRYRVWKTEAK